MEHFIAGPGICLVKIIEPFSSCDFAVLKDVDGPGELPGLRGAAAELAQDVPGLELGIGALTGRS
jgi:hypothetical protein